MLSATSSYGKPRSVSLVSKGSSKEVISNMISMLLSKRVSAIPLELKLTFIVDEHKRYSNHTCINNSKRKTLLSLKSLK